MIRHIDVLADRLIVTTARAGARTLLYSSIAVTGTTQQIEAWVNAWMEDPANDFCRGPAGRYFYCAVRCVSRAPIRLYVQSSDRPIIADDWIT